MQFDVMACAYNVYGFDPTLALIPEFLLGDAASFGSALSELTVTFHFATKGRPRRTLEQDYAEFHAKRLTLPKVVFRRQRGQAAIDVASELIDGDELETANDLSLPLFTGGVTETVEALSLMRGRLTSKDDFRLQEFLEHCRRSQSRLPKTVKQLAAFAGQCEKKEAERDVAASPWDRLGIDWRDFHPDARGLLDDPFYWESANDFAPHGDDTGADLLSAYRGWLRRSPNGDPVAFYRRLLRRWGFRAEPSHERESSVADEAAVALAIAELKLRAECRAEVAALAKAAIDRQRRQALESTDWPHREEKLRTLELIEAVLP